MKNIKFVFSILLLIGLMSCKSNVFKKEPVGKVVDIDNMMKSVDDIPLARVYFEHGNFVNSRNFPPIIKGQDVLENLNQYIIIDIRSKEDYEQGHINGAYNIDKKDVLDFLKNKRKASSADKVVFVCYTGQLASYVTGITRFAGFDNTYVLLYGMAGWNSEFSAPLKNAFGNINDKNLLEISKNSHKSGPGDHHEKIEKEKNIDIDYGIYPNPYPGTVTEIVNKKAKELLSLKRPQFLLKAEEFFEELQKDPQHFYTIAYMKKNQFEFAHIKNAHQFTPRKDISPYEKLGEIDRKKPVVIYCKSGHTAGNVNAMLKMLGYDSYSILLGSSSFMHKLWADQGWQVKDVNALINDFPVIRGKNRTSKNPFIAKATKKMNAAPMPMVKRKKKEVSGGCG